MKIFKGSNAPLKLTFKENVEQFAFIDVWFLHGGCEVMLKLNKEQLDVNNDTIIVPLKQSQTKIFKDGLGTIEIKGKDADGLVRFFEKISFCVKNRADDTILGDDNAYLGSSGGEEIEVSGSEVIFVKKGYSPFIDPESLNWFVYNDELQIFEDSGVKSVGSDAARLTQEEYDNLPEDKKTNGVSYVIL